MAPGSLNLRTFALRPSVEMTGINYDLTFRVECNLGAVHGPGRRPFEVDAFGVVAAAMARAFELIFAGPPVGSTAEVRTHGIDHENTFRVPHHPDPVCALKLGVDKAEIRWITDLEFGFRLVENAGEEVAEKHQKIDTKGSQDCRYHEPAAARDGGPLIGLRVGKDTVEHFQRRWFAWLRTGGGKAVLKVFVNVSGASAVAVGGPDSS